MIKGGFQGLDISGVDLTAQSPTLPGAYEACAAGNGKTILVLTADGAVQCSFKKVSNTFVLAGITGDGKILSITVTSTDGITVSESEPGDEGGVYLDNGVDFSTATSGEPYVTQYDGIIRLRRTGTGELLTSPSVQIKVGSSLNSNTLIAIPTDAVSGYTNACFVKKGSYIYPMSLTSDITAHFLPYKPVE